MQYILSEEEYSNLIEAQKNLKRLPTEDALNCFCLEVANNMKISVMDGWGNIDTRPWGCTYGDSLDGNPSGYCDRCPCKGICTMPKYYSK